MRTKYNFSLFIIIFVIISVLNYICYLNGDKYYKNREEKKKTTQKVFDIGHKYIPDMRNKKYSIIIFNLVTQLPILLLSLSDLPLLFSYMITIYLFRAITINATILPKHKNCTIQKYGIFEILHGHCYDKVFSGHFSFAVLVILFLINKGTISNTSGIIYLLFQAIIIIGVRAHYTVDIILAGYITYSFYKLGIHL